MRRHYSGKDRVILTCWGPWWLNAQRYETRMGDFYGVKVGPLAFYVRWNVPRR